MKCSTCTINKPAIKRPKTGLPSCIECFTTAFEEEIHHTIISTKIFKRGEIICIGVSGGKDSTVLAHVMNHLNKKYDYGLNLYLVSVDEGIKGYRDDSIETVKQNQKDYNLPLKIISYRDLFGWTMDEIVKLIGLNGNCTYCGVFRRQALFKGAKLIKADKVLTGHNADDLAETVLMNMLRGDYHRLVKSVDIISGIDGDMPRVKPFKYTYEKEIVMYAHYKKLVYHSTECIYSPNAYRGHVRELIKELEAQRPTAIIDIIHSAEKMTIKPESDGNRIKNQIKMECVSCGSVSSNKFCKACLLLEKLSKLKSNKNKTIIEFENNNINNFENGDNLIEIEQKLKKDIINDESKNSEV